MIRCHLSRLMGERKMKVMDVARQTGLNRNTVTLLYKETAQRIELDAVEKLCRLFNCGVGELFEMVDDSTVRRAEVKDVTSPDAPFEITAKQWP